MEGDQTVSTGVYNQVRQLRISLILVSALAAAGFSLAMPRSALANSGIFAEGVNKYNSSGCGGSDLPNSVNNSFHFWLQMTSVAPGWQWTNSGLWFNSDVWDTDQYDQTITLQPFDDDEIYFDKSSNAISYFTGHGVCDGSTTPPQLCTSTSQCNNPPAGARMPSSCRQGPPGSGFPPLGQGWCHYMTDRRATTCGSGDRHGSQVNYTSGPVAWGESPNSGQWAGVGTDGGTNWIVLDISCGVSPQFWFEQLGPAFAGAHGISTIMPVTGDTANTVSRGSTWAQSGKANPFGSISDDWLEVVPNLGGGGCSGGGINGCGCNLSAALDVNFSDSNFHLTTESWHTVNGVKDEVWDSLGNASFTYYFICNYNWQAAPFHLP